MAGKCFMCMCPRCAAAEGDDTRRFHCQETDCQGYHLVRQPTSSDAAELSACSCCSKQAPDSYSARMLALEAGLITELARINALLDSGSTVQAIPRIRRLRPPHPHHALAAEVGSMQHKLAHNIGDHEGGALALTAAIACLDKIITFPCRETAFLCEYLGDSLMEAAGSRLSQACEAYRRAVQLLVLTSGASHPYTKIAASKLLAAQKRMRPGNAAALMGPSACSFCGVAARLDGQPLAKCGRCRSAAYCCPEHQKLQWPLHKKSCLPFEE